MGNATEPLTTSDSSLATNPLDVVLLGAAELAETLTAARCLAALEEAYKNLHADPRGGGQSLEFRVADGKFHVKAGLLPGTQKYFAAKVNANFPGNAKAYGLPTIQGLILLCACDNGRPVAVLQSGELTGRRTAAATALAAKYGARPNSSRLSIIGCGTQADYQAEAVADVLPINEVFAFDMDSERAKAFTARIRANLGLRARLAPSIASALSVGDVTVTCTTSSEAIVEADMVPAGAFIAAVGADNPDKQEIDPFLFQRARIIVDDIEQCAKYGDLAHALRAGTVGREDVDLSLAELAAGVKSGRTSEGEIVLFDSTGSGIQDVAAAAAAYEAAASGKDPA